MKKLRFWLRYIIALTSFLLLQVSFFPCTAKAAEKDMDMAGKFYEFERKSEYEISSSEAVGSTENNSTLGVFFISGDITKTSSEDDIPTYEIADNAQIALCYRYNDSMLAAPAEEWHLTEEDKKSVDGISLDEKINNGVIILQTSLDRKKWTVNQIYADMVQPSEGSELEKTFMSNDIQLINGCYYRIIVAYKMERKGESTKILFIDKPNYEYKKYAEVYEFYAGYKKPETLGTAANEKRYSLGILVNTGKSNGYSGANKIAGDDLHYGWELGNFFVSGYTEKTEDQVFLKNVGDKITLWFNLKQDIDELNGSSELKIIEDKDGYDQWFQTPKTNFGRGTLIIRYTDHEGIKSDPIIYENYLEGLTSAGADVKVRLFEEGDYEVALDYEVKNTKGIGKTCDYRISFAFKVRNGNCMVYPFDINTRSELKDSSVTENGFYLDLARSKYLKINITMARWTRGADGYTEDIRYNRPAKDGDQYIDEGIYTIEVGNPSTGKTTEKRIYVGKDSVLKASMNVENAGYTINEIADLVEQGAVIQEDGAIVLPVVETVEETEPSEESEPAEESDTDGETVSKETSDTVNAVKTTVSENMVFNASEIPEISKEVNKEKNTYLLPIICLSLIVGILFIVKKYKKDL